MEAVEDDTTLEAAIGWLADTILANLPRIHQAAGLGNDIGKLKCEVEAVEMVVSAVQGRSAGNKPLARSLAAVKELLYDADDVIDELDGYRLQQEFQPETLLQTDGHGTLQTHENSRVNADHVQSSSNSRLRSKEWVHFDIIESEQNGGPSRARCNYCEKEIMCTTKMGTSVLSNHLKSKACSRKREETEPSSSTADATTTPAPVVTGSRKRMRTGQESSHITAANPNGRWNKDAFSERIQEITSQLQGKHGVITRLLKILPSDSVGANSSNCRTTISDPRRRTSGLFQGKVYGRAQERGSIKTLIEEHTSTAGVTVLPIVGIGGVGKTALAQLVYNDPAVESHFVHKIWIWVSKDFDEMRLTREMLDCVSQETYDGLCSFTKLQEVLKGHIKSKRVLLILDDIWEVMDDCRWNKLLAPFKCDDGANGNMIILTTRKPSVAKKRGTIEPINLDGLTSGHFWLLFKSCAFGDEKYEAQASLTDLGQEISQRLKGNPLAAQTAGALLRDNPTVDHWSNILKTEDWKSLQHTGGIMSALKLSYDELPYHGFVKHDHSNKSLEEIGRCYLTDLLNLGLFEQVERKTSYFVSQTFYVMSGLMHDFATLVSRTECATLDGFQCTDVFPTVHHLSIVTSSVYQRDNQTKNIPRNEKIEFFLQNICISIRKLRTLVLIGEYDSFFFKAFKDVFEKAHNLRLLQMSATPADFNSFLGSLVNPTCLRYLRLHEAKQRGLQSLAYSTHVHTEQKALPHVLSKFFHLQVIDVAFLMPLHMLHVEDCGEWRILPSLEMLRFLKRLKLSDMLGVREVLVPPLEELVLDGMPDLQRCFCTSVGDMKSSIRVLEIQRCPILEVFDLFQKGHNYEIEHTAWFPGLKKLTMHDCPHLQVQIALPPSATFSEIFIMGVSKNMTMQGSSMETFKIDGNLLPYDLFGERIALDDQNLAFHNLKDIKYLKISMCTKLTSISFKGLSQLSSLKSLEIWSCGELFTSDDVPEHTHQDMITANDAALPALESLSIRSCGITGKWLSLILQHSPTLKELELYYCPQLKGKIQSNLLPASEALSSGYLDDALRSSIRALSGYVADARPISVVDGVVHIPLNLRKIKICGCPHLIFDGTKEGFAGFTSLVEEVEEDGQENGRCLLPQSLEQLVWRHYSRKSLRPCFMGNLTCLKKLEVGIGSLEYLQLDSCTALEELNIQCCECLFLLEGMESLGTLRSLVLSNNSMLQSLDLNSCTALERLEIYYCGSLFTVEGLRSLVNLKHLEIVDSPTEGISSHSQELFPALENLKTDDVSHLKTSFCKGLTCLRSLTLFYLDATRQTDDQERALLLLRSLQKLCFEGCEDLVDLPAGLGGLLSLKTLMIKICDRISGLPKKGLPPSLEKLDIWCCSDELSEGCRSLATSKLEVKIDGDYVD
ncbi:putative disease resistance protein RGA1 isoform X2 [Hordeum vulgare subsp. vulgare]|uniref:putative disease resistance protein RGA1 isoform X2 n=1 Tax=Hordeum vulgare subsp. vulgare TaxID=112509 RepID=UPI000B470CC9|nr:putative disease resistance protein RGA1 isoform X2 [Hordeum vulgare subsp. vulgare]